MGSKLESLQERLGRLQEQIETETKVEAAQAAIDKTRDVFSNAITATIAKVEKDTGESLRDIGLGVWVAYPANSNGNARLYVSGLAVGDDGLPLQLKRSSGRVNGGNGSNGASEYVLGDGRVFATCLDAVKALGITVEDSDGNRLDGFKYYHRHDRLPDDVRKQIVKRPKAETGAETSDGAANTDGAETQAQAA